LGKFQVSKGVKMSIKRTMQAHGFEHSDSGGGCEWYTQGTIFNGTKVFIAITDVEQCGVPQELDDPVKVDVYDIISGALVSEVTATLSVFLESLAKTKDPFDLQPLIPSTQTAPKGESKRESPSSDGP
jgi:hypothetical protein